VDLLYVSNGNTIVSYETTGVDGVAIAATMTTFANMGGSSGLAFDLSGNLYVSQMGNDTIRKFNSSGAYVSIINTNLSGPSGLACDTSGNLYAANPYGSYGNTISKFDSSGVYVSNISSNLSSPYGQTFDNLGNLYAANFGGNSISKFDSSGVYLSNITTNLVSPSDLAFDSLGNLYAVNYTSNTISKFDSSGTFLTSWSTGYPLYSLAFRPVSVPEPSTYILAAIAAGVMAYLASRRNARTA
jgi:sugar lactone lactonase YvrE